MSQDLTPDDPGASDGGSSTGGDLVTISRTDLEALLSRQGAAAAPRGAAPDSALEAELASRDRRVAELERAYRDAVRDRELATALAGKPLVPGAAAQLLRLWRDELDVFEEEGSCKVATRDGRTVPQAVGEWLASPDFAHFSLPASRGGSGARGANRPASGPETPGPRNLGEAVVMKWRESSASRAESLLKPIGLRRHR